MTAIPLRPSPCRGQAAAGNLTALQALEDAACWVLSTVQEWRRRIRDRRQLARLDDRMLRDIGLSRAEALYLSSKPFWKE